MAASVDLGIRADFGVQVVWGRRPVPTGDPAREIFFALFPSLSQFYVPNLCHVLVFYFHFSFDIRWPGDC